MIKFDYAAVLASAILLQLPKCVDWSSLILNPIVKGI